VNCLLPGIQLVSHGHKRLFTCHSIALT
jgi:hypothetical protein